MRISSRKCGEDGKCSSLDLEFQARSQQQQDILEVRAENPGHNSPRPTGRFARTKWRPSGPCHWAACKPRSCMEKMAVAMVEWRIRRAWNGFVFLRKRRHNRHTRRGPLPAQANRRPEAQRSLRSTSVPRAEKEM